MPNETQVTMRLDSRALFEALRGHLGDWRLNDHVYDTTSDELAVSYDSEGTGRIALTVAFELGAPQMRDVLEKAMAAVPKDLDPSA